MTRRGGRRRTRPAVQSALPVEAPASTAPSSGTGPADKPAASVPAGQSASPNAPHHQTDAVASPRGQTDQELALLRAAVREMKMKRARRRALRDHPHIAPLADVIEADTPEQYAELAKELAARLQGEDATAGEPSSQTTAPPVGAGCPAIEPPEDRDLERLLAAGRYSVIAEDPALRAEYRRRFGI
jgi:hypothetical protein